MPMMWFHKSGRRPNTQSGPGIPISIEEVTGIFPAAKLRFAGAEAPNVNPDAPSQFPLHVIIEATSEEETSTPLDRVGFYIAMGIKPKEAQTKLEAFRKLSIGNPTQVK